MYQPAAGPASADARRLGTVPALVALGLGLIVATLHGQLASGARLAAASADRFGPAAASAGATSPGEEAGGPVYAVALSKRRWQLVTRIDRHAALAPYQPYVRRGAHVVLGLALVVGVAWLAIRRSRRARFREALIRNRARLNLLSDHAHDPILVVDASGRILALNRSAEVVYGMDTRALEHVTVGRLRAAPQDAPDHVQGAERVFEELHVSAAGTIFPVEVSRQRVTLDGGDAQVWVVRDTSQRVLSAARAERLNRLLHAQLAINQLGVRERDAGRLLQGAARALVDVGGFALAAVGLLPRDRDGGLVPSASAGDGRDDSPTAATLDWSDASPIGRAAVDGETFVAGTPAARDADPAPPAGPSLIVVPLKSDERVVGVLVVSARDEIEPGPEVIARLENLAADVAFFFEAVGGAEERARADLARRRSEARYRTLAEHFPKGSVLLFDQDFCFTLATGESLPMVGLSRSWLEGRTLFDALPEPAVRVLEPMFRGSLVGRKTERLVSFHGRRFNLIVLPVFDDAGQVQAGMLVAQDNTDALRVRDELARLKQFYESVLEAVTEGIWVTDQEGILTYVNQGMATIAGGPKSALLGTPIEAALSGSTDFDLTRLYVEARTSLAPQRYDAVTLATPGGRTTVQSGWFIPIVRNNVYVGMIGTTEDISERHQLQHQLLHAQRLDSLGRLAGGIAHDFNNLLSAILGYSELVAADLSPDDPRREDVQEVIRAAERATGLTRQLLAFSRKQVLQPRTIDVNDAVQDLERMLHRLLGEDIELEIRCDAGDPWVHVDPSQLEQVLVNLVVNARDAMPQGGRLRIDTGNAVRAGIDDMGLSPAHPGPYVVLRVSDTGCGMDSAVMSRIFEPFFTTKEPGRGTGLGLSTVYGIVQQSGGDISVRSAPGNGATFVIYLPVSTVREAPRPVERAHPRSRGTETILVVEDSDPLRVLVRNALSNEGYRVLEASNGEEALHVVKDHSGRIDLVLTDVVMPRLNGIDLVRRLRKETPDLQVLFASGYSPETVLQNEIPGAVFVAKPFKPSALVGRVRSILDEAG